MTFNYRGALNAYKPWYRRVDYKWIGLTLAPMACNGAIVGCIVYVAYHFIAKYW